MHNKRCLVCQSEHWDSNGVCSVCNCGLYVGDAAEVLARCVASNSVHLTVTSPPYDTMRDYRGYRFDFSGIARQLYRVTAPGGAVVWVVADATVRGDETGTAMRQALYFKDIGFSLFDTMIYEIAGTGAKGSNRGYWQTWEYMFVLSKGILKTSNLLIDRPNKYVGTTSRGRATVRGSGKATAVTAASVGRRTNIWRYAVGRCHTGDSGGHPAPFPEGLARDHILSWSNPGDVVLDPLLGSGTTGKMAVLTNRKFIGVDISEEYVLEAAARMSRARERG